MFVRAFRVTDRLGNVFLRVTAWGAMWLVEQAAYLKNGLIDMIVTIWRTLVGTVTVTATTAVTTAQRTQRTARQAYEITQTAVETTADRRRALMAQRSAEAELKPAITQDPLLAQNRALSAFAVLLLLALLTVVVLQTTGDDTALYQLGPLANGLNRAALNRQLPFSRQPSPPQPRYPIHCVWAAVWFIPYVNTARKTCGASASVKVIRCV